MKFKSRRKRLKKAKRLVAAVAGAAVISSALLPAAAAAEPAAAPSPIAEKAPVNEVKEQTPPPPAKHPHQKRQEAATETSPLRAARELAREHGIRAGWQDFSLEWSTATDAAVLVHDDDGQALYRIVLTRDSEDPWTISSIMSLASGDDRAEAALSPVSALKDEASRFGFDADRDHFSLLTKTASKAIVQVRRPGGQTFKIDMERDNGEWVVATVRGIGNMRYPATYIPANLFPDSTVVASPVTAPAEQRILYSNDVYNDWSWQEKNYPGDMHFGIFTVDPNLTDAAAALPAVVAQALADIDYNRQLVFYADLGTVAYKGYGIGIEKVAQANNTLFVTIRVKSPGLDTSAWLSTKATDYVSIDRSTIDFASPVNVFFVTRDGQMLGRYTFLPS